MFQEFKNIVRQTLLVFLAIRAPTEKLLKLIVKKHDSAAFVTNSAGEV